MGTIFALGGGRYDDGEVMPIFERIVRESGKENPHVVFLPTAGHDDTEGDEPYGKASKSSDARLKYSSSPTPQTPASTYMIRS